jgi:hypothetical protein
MQLVMQLACRLYRFSLEEGCWQPPGAAGSRAEGPRIPGAGKATDIQVWDALFEDVIYRLGNNAVSMVVSGGVLFILR